MILREEKTMKKSFTVVILTLTLLSLVACAQTIRRSGQVELFYVDNYDKLVKALSNKPMLDDRQGPIPKFGDFPRFPQDTITVQVHSLYLENLPPTFFGSATGSNDVILFADVWENAATTAYNAPTTTNIVYRERPMGARLPKFCRQYRFWPDRL